MSCLAALFVASAVSVYWPDVLPGFPNWFWPRPRPWWWPFRAQYHNYGLAPLILGIGAAAVMGFVAAAGERMRTLGLVGALTVATLLLNLAVMTLPGRGLAPYARRLVRTSHAEFYARAARNPRIWQTLTQYEAQMHDGQPSTISRNKNPATMVAHILLHRLAQRPPLRQLLDAQAAAVPRLAEDTWKALTLKPFGPKRWGPRYFTDLEPHTGAEVLRTLLLMPLVSVAIRLLLTPVAFALGLALLDRREAILLAIASAAIPPLLFEFVQFDGSLFPLLFLAGVTAFCVAMRRQSPAWAMAAGVLTVFYGYFTLAALVSVSLCAAVGALEVAAGGLAPGSATRAAPDMAGRHGQSASDGPGSHTALRLLGLYLVTSLVLLVTLRLVLSFHVVLRYLDARAIQSTWRQPVSAFSWMALNSFEFALTCGPVLSGLAALGVASSALALLRRRDWTFPKRFTIALVAVHLVLLSVGSNVEVYRKWAFLGPVFLVPAMIAARELGLVTSVRGRTTFVGALLLWTLLLCPRFGFLPPW